VYQQMTGDLEIVARIASLQGSNAWSKGGLMIRESLADNARHAFAHLTVGSGYRLMQRAATGGSTSSALCVSGTAPGWVRLRRSGNVFEMQHSTDGSSWATCRSTQVSMASSVYVGLAVSNVDATRRATAIFDNVSVVPGTNRPPTVTLTSPLSGAAFTAPATIAFAATASDPENRLARVEFYNGSTRLATDTASPFTFSWGSVTAGTYQLRAVAFDADGASAASAIATVTVGSSTTPTKRVAFTASADHAVVTSYLLEVFSPTANTATAPALASSDLGKPTPSSTGEIIVDRTTFLNGLAAGNYLVTVAAVNSGGKSRSAAISFTR
jgi:regulation of enolase protein 1 (concanavalin A-like superfamily)